MARSSSSARSISQVSQESLAVELRGSVQTIFPIHACMPQTANGETQDYGTLGDDGPLEGATKVNPIMMSKLCSVLVRIWFQIRLRPAARSYDFPFSLSSSLRGLKRGPDDLRS